MRSKMARWLVAATLVAVTAAPALAAGRGWLGVSTQPTDGDLRRGLDLARDGLLVNQVESDSPADRAGLKKGDVILTYNSRTVTSPAELRDLVRDTAPGRSASLGVWRDGTRRTLQVRVGELPDNGYDREGEFEAPVPPRAPEAPRAPASPRAPRAPAPPREGYDSDRHRRVIIDGREIPEDEIDDRLDALKDLNGMPEMRMFRDGGGFGLLPRTGRARLGVRIEKLNEDMAQALGASGDKGVLVVEVFGDSPAQKAGLRAGDVVVRLGDTATDDPDALVRAIADRTGKVDIVVQRRGARRTLQAELPERSARSAEPRMMFRGTPGRGEELRNPEPESGRRVYRWKTKGDASPDDADLRRELDDLRRELRQLREELRDNK